MTVSQKEYKIRVTAIYGGRMNYDNLNPINIIIEPGAGIKIDACIYGMGETAVIFSNMDSNESANWNSLIERLMSPGRMLITYKYARSGNDVIHDLSDVVSYARKNNASKIILIAACRGGVISIQSAINSCFRGEIAAIVTLSACQHYEDNVFFTDDDLHNLTLPMMFINSEHDDAIGDTLHMHSMVNGSKELLITPGDSHGSDIFSDYGDMLINGICAFMDRL